jgi:hypothetical protein
LLTRVSASVPERTASRELRSVASSVRVHSRVSAAFACVCSAARRASDASFPEAACEDRPAAARRVNGSQESTKPTGRVA